MKRVLFVFILVFLSLFFGCDMSESENKSDVEVVEEENEIDWNNVDWQNLDDKLLEIAPFDKIPNINIESSIGDDFYKLHRCRIVIGTESNKNFIIHLKGSIFDSLACDDIDKTKIKFLNENTLIVNMINNIDFYVFINIIKYISFSFNDISKKIYVNSRDDTIVIY